MTRNLEISYNGPMAPVLETQLFKKMQELNFHYKGRGYQSDLTEMEFEREEDLELPER